MLWFLFFLLFSAESLFALDKVIWKNSLEDEEKTSVGRTLEMAKDGGLLFQERDGVIRAFQPEMIVKATRSNEPFVPMTQDEAAEKVLAELPEGFRIFKTANYVVCYQTSQLYAQWCGMLMENLYATFAGYWKNQKRELAKPEFPLIMIVFASSAEYKKYGKDVLGGMGDTIIGYYSMETNRVVCYDLSGRETFASGQKSAAMNFGVMTREIMRRPQAAGQIATIIHEATHQLAHNRGLAARYADVPLWFNEGLALFFESPDMNNAKGWSGAGKVNQMRLAQHRDYLPRRAEGSLRKLISDDSVLRGAKTAADGYAEAWALTYFLLKTRTKDFMAYTEKIRGKKPLRWDDPAVRIRDFEACFGNVEEVEKKFLAFMRKLRE